MQQLSYQVLKEIKYKGFLLQNAPERVLQFGEGNFLRGFVDYFIDLMNERAGFNGKVVVCQPIDTGLSQKINEQEGLYTLCLRGVQEQQVINEKRVISCISRCINPYQDFVQLLDCAHNPALRYIVCNTTEAGIVYDENCKFQDEPASSYPGKLTQFLYERFQCDLTNDQKGMVILSCELIDNNGNELKRCVLQYAKTWGLGEEFIQWIHEENIFCSTLVDRIVTGYPRDEAEKLYEELGYRDTLLNTGEIFGLWVIEGPENVLEELPFKQANLPVIVTNNHTPYKQRKVRILNGAHTAFVLGAFLSGQYIVRDCMEDPVISGFMEQLIYQEIIPTLELKKEELREFAASVTERFKNPFIDHKLLAISLNSTAKWKARILPTLKAYQKITGQLPSRIILSFAMYLAFYRGHALTSHGLVGNRDGQEYLIQDDQAVLEFYYQHCKDTRETLVEAVASQQQFWGENLLEIPGFQDAVVGALEEIDNMGVYVVMKKYCIETI